MFNDSQNDSSFYSYEGRRAFAEHGVTGGTMHGYAKESAERMLFVSGFSDERHRAAMCAVDEAKDYHALTVREAPTDRAWAEKLSAC